MKRIAKAAEIVFGLIAMSLVVRGLMGVDVSNSTLAIWVGTLGVRSVVDGLDQ